MNLPSLAIFTSLSQSCTRRVRGHHFWDHFFAFLHSYYHLNAILSGKVAQKNHRRGGCGPVRFACTGPLRSYSFCNICNRGHCTALWLMWISKFHGGAGSLTDRSFNLVLITFLHNRRLAHQIQMHTSCCTFHPFKNSICSTICCKNRLLLMLWRGEGTEVEKGVKGAKLR